MANAPASSSVYMAIVHIAIYDTVNHGDREER